MPVTINLYGGGLASSAGDAMLMSLDDRYVLVDLGLQSVYASLVRKDVRSALGAMNARMTAVITHFHDDHIASGQAWKDLNSANVDLYYPEPVTKLGIDKRDAMLKALGNLKPGVANSNGANILSAVSGGGVRCEVYVITSGKADPTVGENATSLGALIVVTRPPKDPFVFLTLGDMVPGLASDNVAAVYQKATSGLEAKVLCVKLAHHGSENNLLACLDKIVDSKTSLFSLGYTGTAMNKLADRLETWEKPRIKFVMTPDKVDFYKEMTANYALLEKNSAEVTIESSSFQLKL